MRFSVPLLCLWAASSASAVVFSHITEDITLPRVSSLEQRAKCDGLSTRDPTTCQCRPEFDDPGRPKRECNCPDYPNTVLIFTKEYDPDADKYKETAACMCRQPGQIFNTATKKCQCPAGFKATRNLRNELTCKQGGKPTTVTVTATRSSQTSGPTGGTAPRRRANLREAIRRREAGHISDLEAILLCKEGERACKVSGDYKCIDIQSSLASCGACPGEATDCGALPGIDQVTCLFGRCTIDTCRAGYLLRWNKGNDRVPFFCDAK